MTSYIQAMIRIAPLLALTLVLAGPLQAQNTPAPVEPETEGTPFLDRLDRMFRDFMTEIEPQMRELQRGFEGLEPELQNLLERMRGLTEYHPPEIQPNGDILIRRRQAEDGVPDPDAPMPQDEPAPSRPPFEL